MKQTTAVLQSVILTEQPAQVPHSFVAGCLKLPAMTGGSVDLPGCYNLPNVHMQTSKYG